MASERRLSDKQTTRHVTRSRANPQPRESQDLATAMHLSRRRASIGRCLIVRRRFLFLIHTVGGKRRLGVTRTSIRIAAALAAGTALAAAAATAGGAASLLGSAGPIKVGISLSLSGDFSDSGKAAENGYQLWRNLVNAR